MGWCVLDVHSEPLVVRRNRIRVLPERALLSGRCGVNCRRRLPACRWAEDRCAAPTVVVQVLRPYPLPAGVSQCGVGGGIGR